MPDNVAITAGSGTLVATDQDQASGAHAQLMKLAISADGSLTLVPADAANGLKVDVSRVSGVVHVDDNAGSLTVDGTVSVGNFPATQPVSLASNTPDVTDRAARLLGHVTVDAAPTTAVTGPLTDAQLRAAAVPVSLAAAPTTAVTGPLTDAQLRASAVPVSDARLPVALKTLPAGADGLAALPVYITSILLLSYDAAARNIAAAPLVANTAKQVLSIEHAASSTKTVKIRRIMVGGLQTAAVAGMVDIQITKGTAASTGGTVVTPNTRKGGDAAPEAVVKSLPTIVAGTLGDTIPWGATAATANTPMPTMLVYDWQEGGETKPLQLRAGQLETIVINVISTAAQALTMTVSVDFTEE